jgi:hypothetical protein
VPGNSQDISLSILLLAVAVPDESGILLLELVLERRFAFVFPTLSFSLALVLVAALLFALLVFVLGVPLALGAFLVLVAEEVDDGFLRATLVFGTVKGMPAAVQGQAETRLLRIVLARRDQRRVVLELGAAVILEASGNRNDFLDVIRLAGEEP